MESHEPPMMSKTVPRIYLLQRLREELLGPKNGPTETLLPPTDPREEYTTGVLDAVSLPSEELEEIELLEAQEPAVPQELESLGEDEEGADPLLMAAEFAPTVDPRRLPCSLGLTFFLVADARASVELCASAGRYSLREGAWHRVPFRWTLGPLDQANWNGDFQDPESGMRVVVRSRRQTDGLYRLSVYLLNQGQWNGMTRERASRFLYQPQLRVRLLEGCQLQGLHQPVSGHLDQEERRLQLMYRKTPVMGRGHMCAAVWREIDPEQEAGSPFGWDDGLPELERFARCDLRTELMPMLAVPTPFADWRDDLGPAPERQALRLSELSQARLTNALEPLATAYEAWLESCDAEISSLPQGSQEVARAQVELGREALARMRDGMELISQDREAYLAFCFANRAVHEQASWGGGGPLQWRPFQLGFILLCLRGLADPNSDAREICDLLWFPTGGGKTEAYLALTAFTLGIRRLRHPGYDGVGVISRYTLRLLSIQQFRRALKLITACEILRVQPHPDGLLGWRPEGSGEERDWLWGKHRFSAGLWLGGTVTPNQLEGVSYKDIPGGFDLLEDDKRGQSDPAQVTECPACAAHLAVLQEEEGSLEQTLSLHLRVKGCERTPTQDELSTRFVEVLSVQATRLSDLVTSLHLEMRSLQGGLDLDSWWSEKRRCFGAECFELCVRASRPGYYIEHVTGPRGKRAKQRIELFCPNPTCPTSRHEWQEVLPLSVDGEAAGLQPVPQAVAVQGSRTRARQCPIPAVMVDEQLYAWPPSLLVSTVDKFARLAFESRASCLFGNVEFYHAHEGFYRQGCLRRHLKSKTGHPAGDKLRVEVPQLPPPDLVIQDELHLIDGPLGSMVGLYETVVSRLCGQAHRLKYVASTATVREAADQVQALFARGLRQFPPPSLDANDSFFALLRPTSVMQETGSGRLYLGYSAPGRGALTPQVRVWATILQAAEELRQRGVPLRELDPYWSPVGYFTTIRNLAATASLWRQAIPLRLEYLGGQQRRELSPAPMELSSRISSSRLPGLLNRLNLVMPGAVDGVLSTSMFGTGVDVSRLSLMVVHGQPKTTSAYIQATGRVGRQSPGLVVTVLPATNPRSLDHYEFFTGYHRQLYRGVEPVTVYPFAPRARERAVGPLCTALLRQLPQVDPAWRERGSGARMMATAWDSPEVKALIDIFEKRARTQPDLRRPDDECLAQEVRQALMRWKAMAELHSDLQLEEYTLAKRPEVPVVLGDPQHVVAKLDVVYPNAPQSLREIEPTTGFRI